MLTAKQTDVVMTRRGAISSYDLPSDHRWSEQSDDKVLEVLTLIEVDCRAAAKRRRGAIGCVDVRGMSSNQFIPASA
jgi:hypothetical protein